MKLSSKNRLMPMHLELFPAAIIPKNRQLMVCQPPGSMAIRQLVTESLT